MLPRLLAATVAGLVIAAPAVSRVTGLVDYAPVYTPDRGLELTVENVSKLPATVDGVEVVVGSSGARSGCRVTLPAITLRGTESARVTIAAAAVVAQCVGTRTADTRGFLLAEPARALPIAGRALPFVRVTVRSARPTAPMTFALTPARASAIRPQSPIIR